MELDDPNLRAPGGQASIISGADNDFSMIWFSGSMGPGSGHHWADGIHYKDWSLWGGSATYRQGLSMGLTDLGGNLYRINSDGSRDMYDLHNGQRGFWKDEQFSSRNIMEINGEKISIPTPGVKTTFHAIEMGQGGDDPRNWGPYLDKTDYPYYSRSDTGSKLMDVVSQGITGVGVYATVNELALVDKGYWKSPKTGNWYPIKNNPNGVTGPKSATIKAAGKWGALSRGTFYLGTAISLIQFASNPSMPQAAQSATDIFFGFLGAYGGVPGAFFSTAYFGDQMLRYYSPSYNEFQNTQSRLNQQYRAYDVCFKEGTQIYAEDGLLGIEKLKVGMNVFSYNFDTGEIELKSIERCFVRHVQNAYELDLGHEIIIVTEEHPFYANEKWIKVKDLKVNDTLSSFNGESIAIKSIRRLNEPLKVYNIEVAGNHNYYVSLSKVLVHNKSIVIDEDEIVEQERESEK